MKIEDLLSVCHVHVPESQIEKVINIEILKGLNYWVNSTDITETQVIKMCSVTLAYKENKMFDKYINDIQKMFKITQESGYIIDVITVENTDIIIKMSKFLKNEPTYVDLRKKCCDYHEIRIE